MDHPEIDTQFSDSTSALQAQERLVQELESSPIVPHSQADVDQLKPTDESLTYGMAYHAARRLVKIGSLKTDNALKGSQVEQLEGQVKDLSEQAGRDPLTGLYNRRVLQSTYDKMQKAYWSHSKDPRLGTDWEKEAVHALIIDADKLKTINDTAGHAGGDEMLVKIAQNINNAVRERDIAARPGGDEFTILLARTTLPEAKLVAERIRKSVEQIREVSGIAIQASLSIGIGTIDFNLSLSENLKPIDDALYLAKKNGRNQVVIATVSSPISTP